MNTELVTPIRKTEAEQQGEQIRSLRVMAGISQSPLAAKVAESIPGFNRPRLSMAECGHVQLSVEEQVAITSAILLLARLRLARVLTATQQLQAATA